MSAGVVIRAMKAMLVAAMALYFVLVGADNIIDYGTNFSFVRNVLSMDAVHGSPRLSWRSITDPSMHHAAYALIITWELLAGAACAAGAYVLLQHARVAREFERRKGLAVVGLGAGLLLWLCAFITIGGEWFQMWQAPVNGEMAAFRMFTVNGIVMVLLVTPESES